MRLVGESFSTVASSLAEVQGDSKRGGTGRDVDRGTTGKVETAHDKRPAVGVPRPASKRTVDEGEPAEEEDHNGADTGSFSETTNGEDAGDDLLQSASAFARLMAHKNCVFYSRRTCTGRYRRQEQGFGQNRLKAGPKLPLDQSTASRQCI